MSVELNKEIKLNEAQKPRSKPMFEAQVQKCKYQLSKCKCKRAKVAIIKDKGRIDFYPTLNTCRMRIKAQDKKEIRG